LKVQAEQLKIIGDILSGHTSIYHFERSKWREGSRRVAGVDEVGRGCLAGPVVAAAVILDQDLFIPGLSDSKKLTPGKRQEIFDLIRSADIDWGIGIIGHEVIDEVNILQATRFAMHDAILKLRSQPDFLLIDALVLPDVDIPQQGILKGDSVSASIMAASIIAKVTRDKIMDDLDSQYPGYGFAKHKGYGTADHFKALEKLGPCPCHRRSFKGVVRPEDRQ
jgi:ribonuclease HII